jgi:hypothetical protein
MDYRVIGFFVRFEHGFVVIAGEGRGGYVVSMKPPRSVPTRRMSSHGANGVEISVNTGPSAAACDLLGQQPEPLTEQAAEVIDIGNRGNSPPNFTCVPN